MSSLRSLHEIAPAALRILDTFGTRTFATLSAMNRRHIGTSDERQGLLLSPSSRDADAHIDDSIGTAGP
jgi:hypothetical protein